MNRARRYPPVGRSVFLAVLALAASGTAAAAFVPSGLLELHHVNVQQGDCTLIIGPDGTTVLIDGGNNAKGNGEVVPYLQSLGLIAADGLDYMIATHGDADHVGGLDEVIQAGYDVRLAVYDNGSGSTTQTMQDFRDAAATTTAGPLQKIPLGTMIALGDEAVLRCVAVDGEVLGFGFVSGASNNENDLSVALLVQYKDFDYVTAGDLGGGQWAVDNNCTGRTTGQVNVESPLAQSLMPGGGAGLLTADGVEVLDVNHHGSESSTNHEWMNLLTPRVAVINVGAGQGGTWNHPRKDVVENVLLAQASCVTAAAALVLQTEEGSPTGPNTSFAGHCAGDVIVKTTGLGTFQVSATGAVSQGPDERVAAGVEPPADFPVDGSAPPPPPPSAALVINEIMQNPNAVSDTDGEWFELHNPGTSGVDIEGWTIRDNGADLHVIASGGPLVVPAGGYLVLGRNGDPATNGGYLADYVYGGFLLANADDEVVLEDATGTVVDQVAYTGASPWPNPTGASMELADPALDNADGANWAAATVRGGTFDGSGADLGTPGAANGTAPPPPPPASELHVHGLTVTNVALNGNRWQGEAAVTVHDQDHQPVAGATVTGDWSGNTTESGTTATTDGSGTATIGSKKVKNPSGSFCFDVTDLAASGFAYDPAADVPQTPPAVCSPPVSSFTALPEFTLGAVEPNPFAARTTVRLTAPVAAGVRLRVFDLRGRLVATLAERRLEPGEHVFEWDGRDLGGAPARIGLYFLALEVGPQRAVRKVTLLR